MLGPVSACSQQLLAPRLPCVSSVHFGTASCLVILLSPVSLWACSRAGLPPFRRPDHHQALHSQCAYGRLGSCWGLRWSVCDHSNSKPGGAISEKDRALTLQRALRQGFLAERWPQRRPITHTEVAVDSRHRRCVATPRCSLWLPCTLMTSRISSMCVTTVTVDLQAHSGRVA